MNLFLFARGAAEPWRLSIEGPEHGDPVTLTFEEPAVVVGRDPAAGLRLAGSGVHDRHVYLQRIGHRLYGKDLAPHGVFGAGPGLGEGWIEPGQAFEVGPHRLCFLPPSDPDGPEPSPPEEPDIFEPVLQIRLRGIRSISARAARPISLLGSSADCQIRLLDPAVDPIHCSLVPTPGGLWVVDLLGKGGVFINGEPVRFAPLGAGDELRIGQTTIRLPVATSEPGPKETASLPEIPAPSVVDVEPEPAERTEPSGSFPWTQRPSFPATEAPRPRPEERGGEPDREPSFPPAHQHDERRSSYRYQVANTRARLCWWEKGNQATARSATPSQEPAAVSGFLSRAPALWNSSVSVKRERPESGREPSLSTDILVSRSVSIELIDLSQAGLSVLGDDGPPAGHRVWFRLEEEPGANWVELLPVGSRTGDGPASRRFRFAFRHYCPYELFKALVIESRAPRGRDDSR